MRYSTDRDDPGYLPYEAVRRAGQDVHIYLDGQVIKDAVTVDDEAGMVVRYCRNGAGDFYLVGSGEGASIARETLTGSVVIEIKDVRRGQG
jgi:nucleoside-diphosphate-sugar epimerase